MAAAVNKCDTDVISVLLEYGAGASINAKDCVCDYYSSVILLIMHSY